MFGSSLPSALGWLATTEVYSGTGADIVMESITLTTSQKGHNLGHSLKKGYHFRKKVSGGSNPRVGASAAGSSRTHQEKF